MAKEITVRIATSWDDVSLEQFTALQNIDPNLSNEDSYIAAIVTLSNLSREEVLNLPYPEFVKLSTRLNFMSKLPERKLSPVLTLDGKQYTVTTLGRNLIAGQFLDFKRLLATENLDMRLARLCSCFVYPQGCHYGEGYDTEEHVKVLWEHMSAVEAHSIIAFFTEQSAKLTEHTLKSLERQMKKLKTTTAEQATLKKQIAAKLREARGMLSRTSGGRWRCLNV